jgi:glutamine amidotransferase
VGQAGGVDITIIDYGMGNLRNVQKAFEHMDIAARISSLPADLDRADGWVLPGVGAFGDAMDNLRDAGLVEPIRRGVARGKPLLGICLGLQLLFEESNEMGQHRGLGVLSGRVIRFEDGVEHADQTLKVPHVGWNQFHVTEQGRKSPLLEGVPDGSYAYFVHSYYVVPADPDDALAMTDYGINFCSVVGRGNVFGAQPHPEKSQEVGLKLLHNYAQIVAQKGRVGGNDHLSGD